MAVEWPDVRQPGGRMKERRPRQQALTAAGGQRAAGDVRRARGEGRGVSEAGSHGDRTVFMGETW